MKKFFFNLLFKLTILLIILGIITYFAYQKISFVQEKLDPLLVKYTPLKYIPGNKFSFKRKIELKSTYGKLDEYARNTPKKYEKNIKTLVKYLIKPAKTDIKKARVLFTWIATHVKYDDDSYNKNKIPNQSANRIFRVRKAVCEGYSNLYRKMARIAGLKAVKIIGYAKSYGRVDGQKFKDTNHAWNAVKVDGNWKLFDVTWAAGFGETVNGKLVSKVKFDNYWFDVNPKEFIFSHLPLHYKWASLDKKITLSQYEKMPKLEMGLFKCGFPSDEIFEKITNGKLNKVVKSYSIDTPFKVISAPYKANLLSNRNYTLKFKSEYVKEMALINNGEWVHFKHSGNLFSLNYRPKKGKLTIMLKQPSEKTNYSTILIYKVN